jgi:hypothetical protein
MRKALTDFIRRTLAGARHDLGQRRRAKADDGEGTLLPAFDPTLPQGTADYGPTTARFRRDGDR